MSEQRCGTCGLRIEPREVVREVSYGEFQRFIMWEHTCVNGFAQWEPQP